MERHEELAPSESKSNGSELSGPVTNLTNSSEEPEVDLEEHDELLEDCKSLLMSKHEIIEDFKACREKLYRFGGSCVLAASDSERFFNEEHKLMRPKAVTGILYSPSGGKLTMHKSGKSPDQAAKVIASMKAFQHDEACIWVQDESFNPVVDVHGASHRVTVVTTPDGERIVVDWGIAQFTSVPKDIKLFINEKDL
ncbi:hypothetical protein ABPG77_001836 [Micractinium sp. CCAP 211/92]